MSGIRATGPDASALLCALSSSVFLLKDARTTSPHGLACKRELVSRGEWCVACDCPKDHAGCGCKTQEV